MLSLATSKAGLIHNTVNRGRIVQLFRKYRKYEETMREIGEKKAAEERREEIDRHIDEYLKSGGKIELRGYLEKHDTKRASRRDNNSNKELTESGE
jgi:hypothetical protein